MESKDMRMGRCLFLVAGFALLAAGRPTGGAWSGEAVAVSVNGVVSLASGLPVAVSVELAKAQAMRKALEQGGRAEAVATSEVVDFELIHDVMTINAEGLIHDQQWQRFPNGQDWIEENGMVRVRLDARVDPPAIWEDWRTWERLMKMRGTPRFLLTRLSPGPEESASPWAARCRDVAFAAMEEGLRRRGMRFQDASLLKRLREMAADDKAVFRLPPGSVLASERFPVDFLAGLTVTVSAPGVRSVGATAREITFDVGLSCDIIDASGVHRLSGQHRRARLGPYLFAPPPNTAPGHVAESWTGEGLDEHIMPLVEGLVADTWDAIMRSWSRVDNQRTRMIVAGIQLDELLRLEAEIKDKAATDLDWRFDLSEAGVAAVEITSELDAGIIMRLVATQGVVPMDLSRASRQGREIAFVTKRSSAAAPRGEAATPQPTSPEGEREYPWRNIAIFAAILVALYLVGRKITSN